MSDAQSVSKVRSLVEELEANSETRDPSNPDSKPVKSQATKLVELGKKRCELFHDAEQRAYAVIKVQGVRQTWPISSKSFRQWLRHMFFDIEERTPSSQALQDAINTIEGEALFRGEEKPVFLRTAQHGGKLYLDLANSDWEAVEISGGSWRVTTDLPVHFCRPSAMLPLPTPVRGGSLDDLESFINAETPDDLTMIKAFLVFCLDPIGPYPILALSGPQGSAKSTATRVVKNLVDPSKAPLRSAPKDEDNLFVAAQHSCVIAFDNLSSIPSWLSDGLCRLATGGGVSKRELYTDAEEVVLEAKRPVIFNGIGDLIDRPDLLDRALPVRLRQIPEGDYLSESALREKFAAVHPQLLGAILDAVAAALVNEPSVHLDHTPRMADFARRVESAAPALGWKKGHFLEVYERQRKLCRAEAAQDDPMCSAIIYILTNDQRELRTTATELLERLNDVVNKPLPHDWPRTPKALSNRLRRIQPILRDVGVELEFRRNSSNRWIILKQLQDFEGDSASQPSLASSDDSNPPYV